MKSLKLSKNECMKPSKNERNKIKQQRKWLRNNGSVSKKVMKPTDLF